MWCGGPSSRDQAAVYKVDKSPGCQSDLARAGAQLSLPVKMFSSLISGPGQTHCRLLGTKAIKTSNISNFFNPEIFFIKIIIINNDLKDFSMEMEFIRFTINCWF